MGKVKTVSASEFRVQLKALMKEVYDEGTTVIVAKHKQVMAVLVPPDHLDRTQKENDCTQDENDSEVEVEESLSEPSDDTPKCPSRPKKPE